MNLNIKQIVLITIAVILMVYSTIDYNKHNYDITGFNLKCNDKVCTIQHKKGNAKIKYTEQFNVNTIDYFYSKLEKIPNTKNDGLAIYAHRTDGTSFRLSPIYVKPSKYLESELIQPLNQKINKRPILIDIKFPY